MTNTLKSRGLAIRARLREEADAARKQLDPMTPGQLDALADQIEKGQPPDAEDATTLLRSVAEFLRGQLAPAESPEDLAYQEAIFAPPDYRPSRVQESKPLRRSAPLLPSAEEYRAAILN